MRKRVIIASTCFLVAVACASHTLSRYTPKGSETCPGSGPLATFMSSLRLADTYLDVNADEIERLTGFRRNGAVTTIERQPATGTCNCCTTITYEGNGRVRSVVIIRTLEGREAANALVRDLLRASQLPNPTTEAPGDDVALYRWSIPASTGRQLGLDVSYIPVERGLVRVHFVLGVL
jgi:hypothetical protein